MFKKPARGPYPKPVKSNAQQHTSLTVRSIVTLASYPHWSFPKISSLFLSDIPIKMQYTFLLPLKHTRLLFPIYMLSLLSCPWWRQLYRIESQYLPEHPVKPAVLTLQKKYSAVSVIFLKQHKLQLFHFVIFSTLAIFHPFQFQLPHSPQLLNALNIYLLKTWEKNKFGVFLQIL